MKTIWKYLLRAGENTVPMPRGAVVLDAQMQGLALQLWALVDLENITVPNDRLGAGAQARVFVVHGTGQPVSDAWPLQHISTVQLMGGELIYHVFEVIK